MKVLVIHNFHQKGSASGDDVVFKSETKLLEDNGVEVIRYSVSNDSFFGKGPIAKINAAKGMMWSFKNYNKVKEICKKEKPDIVHAHTFFPLLSPSILYAAKRSGAKVVATLHDTRFICPCATSLRGTQICNDCKDGKYFRMCKYKCFKGSRLQSFIVSCVFKYHRLRRSFYNQIDKYIILNNNQLELLKEVGYDPNKIVKKYNFVPDNNVLIQKHEGIPDRYVVFYGRTSEEKGIRNLMKMWDSLDIPLVIMGNGNLEEEVRNWANTKKNVYFLGYTEHDKCLSIVKGSEFVVFPSIWYEGCSMVEIETESLSKGIIASDIGFSCEAIKDGYNGYKIKLGDLDAFKKKIVELWNDLNKCKELGLNARKDYESKYLPKDNFKQLINIYKEVLNND